MNTTKTKFAVAIVTGIAVIVGTVMIVKGKQARADELEQRQQAAKITATAEQIKQANVGLPDPQVQAKTLIFTAMIQKKIPESPKWCEILNVDGKLWPVTPTNTVFALNPAVAGRIYSRTNRPAPDVVVFFETSRLGWNQSGGAELLARRPEGVAVALADGRTLLVTPAETARLRWTP